MRILVFGINHYPEPTGIGKYTGEMVEWLAARGHATRVITAMPYYPWWRKPAGYRRWWYRRERIAGVRVLRCPLYVPRPDRVTSLRRMVHELTFTVTALVPWLGVLFSPRRPDAIVTIVPATQSAILPVTVGRLRRIPVFVHVQDLQVDAAIQLGMLRPAMLGKVMTWLESYVLRSATEVSTISEAMRQRVNAKGVDPDRSYLFPNWADPTVVPRPRDNEFRTALGVAVTDVVVLYAGTVGEKQGLDVLLDTAALLADRPEIQFVVAGNGSAKTRLQERAETERIASVRFLDTQPVERLADMLASADIHVVLQRSSAADLVLPSKLVNILASGRPCVVTAESGSTLADTLSLTGAGRTCALDADSIALEITDLSADPDAIRDMGEAGARYAQAQLAIDPILTGFEERLTSVVSRR